MKRIILNLAALAVTLGGAAQARAGVLLDLEDPPGQTETPVAIQFIAGSTSTTIAFAGYQPSSALEATSIELTLAGSGPNLLGEDWTFTPAPFGSFASTFDDGTGVPTLDFEGFIEDSFDTFSQTVATQIGQSYSITFLFLNDPESPTTGELVVSATGTASSASAPEPSTLVMSSMLTGLFGGVWIHRRLIRTIKK
jgi:hypothetical protein